MLETYRANTNFWVIFLKTNEKLIKNWNELLLIGSLETNKFNQTICLRLDLSIGWSKLSTVCQLRIIAPKRSAI